MLNYTLRDSCFRCLRVRVRVRTLMSDGAFVHICLQFLLLGLFEFVIILGEVRKVLT